MDEMQKMREIQYMERVWQVYTHPLYVQNQQENLKAEEDRIFCRHNMEHLMSVARLAYIFKLERKYNVSKEIIYITSLLHDIGKWRQYREGVPHEIASAEIAEKILLELRFSFDEIELVKDAILAHRNGKGKSELAEILFDADKMSRSCFSCDVKEKCNWKPAKKNERIMW